MENMKRLLAIGIILLFLGMSISSSTGFNAVEQSSTEISNGKTLYVGGLGPNNYSKIQDAIDNASDGDTVFVYDDSSPYYERVKINKSIDLIGENRDTTIIDAKRKGNIIFISSNNVSIKELTLQNSSGLNNASIKIDFDFGICTISDNIIIDNDNGVSMYFSGNNNTIKDNIFFNNKETSIKGSHHNNNIISGNTFDHPAGIYQDQCIRFHSCARFNISGNTIKKCNSGITLDLSNNNLISENIISTVGYEGIRIRGSNNKIIGNNLVGGGIQDSDSVNSIIAYNTISYNRWGITLRSVKNTVISKNNITGTTYGVETEETSNITISENHFTTNHISINIVSSSDTVVSENSIDNNINGIRLQNSLKTEIRCNNFKDNTQRNALFSDCNNTVWDSNYWNRPHILPKILFGKIIHGNITIPWINIDWHPAKEPYDIGVL